MKKYILFSLLLFFSTVICLADNTDRKIQKLLNGLNEKQKIKVLDSVAISGMSDSINFSFACNAFEIELAKKYAGDINLYPSALVTKTKLLIRNNAYDSAADVLDEVIAYCKKNDLEETEGHAYYQYARINFKLSKYQKSAEYAHLSLAVAEKFHNKGSEGATLNLLGSIYFYQENFEKAAEYYKKNIAIQKELKNERSLILALDNLGLVYSNLKNYKEALFYQTECVTKLETLNDPVLLEESYINIGATYKNMKDFRKAQFYFAKALEINIKIDNKYGIAAAMINIADILKMNKDYRKALNYLLHAYKISKAIDTKQNIYVSSSNIAEIYEKLKKPDSALYFLNETLVSSKEIFKTESSQKINELNARYGNFKKEQEINVLKKENELKQVKIKQEQLFNLLLFIGIGFSVVLVAYVFYSLNQKKKANKKLEEQNQQITSQHNELTFQKKLVDEKNKEITDSINYARRIQQSIIPSDEEMKKNLKDYFALFKPKDIVSGDFYWCANVNSNDKKTKYSIISAIDCTGHGVPGGFMSMLANTLLNQTIINAKINTPSDILNFLNHELPKNLKSGDNKYAMHDGMDISLCAIDFDNMKLYFSGANNPCWIIRDDQCIELKADKQLISAGNDVEKKSFSTQEFGLKKNDCIYLFTDGYADQFGGPNGKKFKYKQLQDLLTSINVKELTEQKNILEENFETWKGNLEQIDDVLVIGIKI